MVTLSRALRITAFTIIAIAVMATLPVSAQTGLSTQNSTPPPPDTVAVAEPLTRIPTTEIPKRAEETSTALRDIRGKTGWDPEILGIAEEFPQTSFEIDERSSAIDSVSVQSFSFGDLSEELQWWDRERSHLNSWAPKVAKRSNYLVAARDDIRDVRTTWELTRDSADEVEMPEAILGRVVNVLAAIDTVYLSVTARIDTVLTLQDQLSQKLVFVDETISNLKKMEGNVQRMLFATDSPPIWKLVFAHPDSNRLRETARASWESNWISLKNYISRYESRFIDQLITAILVLIALIALGWQSRRWSVEGDKDLETAVAILKRPLAVALLTVLLIPGVYHPQAPNSIHQLMQLLVLFPLLRLLPIVVAPAVRKPVYFIAVLFALDQVLHLAPELSGLQRLLQIFLAGLSILGFVWLLRRVDRSALTRGWGDAAIFMTRLAIVLLGLSVLGNAFGFASLANHLLSGTMTSGYWAILLAAAYRVAKAVLAGILQTNAARKLRGIRLHTPIIRQRVYRVLRLAAVVIWIYGTLHIFDLWSVFWNGIVSVGGKEWVFGSMSLSIGDVLFFFFVIWASFQVSKFVSFVLSEDILPHLKLPRGVPSAITRVSGMVIVVFGFVVAAATVGVDLNKFTLLAGALGVGIGFGMQNIVNNFISGLILIFERPISAGDLIQYGTTWGTVQRIGFRSSTLRTFSGADVIVPNGNLISTEVINWSRSDQHRRVEIKVGVAYGTDPGTVIEVLEKTIQKHPDVFKEPQPYAVFHGFGDSSLDFEIRGWTNLDDWLRVTTETTVMVNNAIKEAGIEIPFPQRDLHLRTVDPDVEDALAGRKRKPPVARAEPQATPRSPEHASRTQDQDLDGDAE